MNVTLRHAPDVRPVEPKHRLDADVGAYDSLADGATLDLTMDHGPRCMYYTLGVRHGESISSFEYGENGPQAWRLEVSKT